MKLESCPKIAYGRCEPPEQTISRLEAIIGSMVTYRIVEEKVADHLHWSALFIDELDFRSMGKGVTSTFSRAGALAEGAEWLTARDVAMLPGYITAHQDNVSNPVSLDALLSHVQTATPEVLEKVKNTDCAHHWVDGCSLKTGQPCKVPIEFVRRINGPNGRASGNRIEEAIVHAVNEVFERRAHVTVLRNRLVMPTIDMDSIENAVLRDQIAFLQERDIEITLKDLSFEGRLPCVGAYFVDPNVPEEFQFHHFFKVGASFNREDALARVFTEYVQGRRADEFIDGSATEQRRLLDHDFRGLRCVDTGDDRLMSAFLFGFVPYRQADFLREGPIIPFNRGECFDDCLDDVGRALEICSEMERDLIVVDFTDPEAGFPVVQAVIPGYSDVLPYHPHWSTVLFRDCTREDVIRSYEKVEWPANKETT